MKNKPQIVFKSNILLTIINSNCMPGRSLSDEDRSASLSASFHRDNAMHEAVAQPEHVGILAAEVYFPNTYVS